MGLFSSKTRTYVSSSLYNMAGDINERPQFARETLVGAVLAGNGSIADTLQSALLGGSGMNQRRFFQWARSNYGGGLATAQLDVSQNVDPDVVSSGLAAYLSLGPNDYIKIHSSEISDGDIDYWAENWVMGNYPALTEADWSADWDRQTQEIVISLPGDTIVRLAAPADLLWAISGGTERRRLLFVAYSILSHNPDEGSASESGISLFTYRIGSGNVIFDALDVPESELNDFFPVMPLRLNNVSIRDESMSDLYEDVNKAHRKLTRQSVEDTLDNLEDNESINDIDYAFIAHGVALNTPDKAGLAYLYAFFERMRDQQTYNALDFDAYRTAMTEAYARHIEWSRWQSANGGDNRTHPQFGRESPAQPYTGISRASRNEIRIHAPDTPDFDIRLSWNFIRETQHIGNAAHYDGDSSRELLKKGHFWITEAPNLTIRKAGVHSEHGHVIWRNETYERIYLFRQYDHLRFSRLEIVGLEHNNYVYRGHAARTTAKQALADDEESGFLVPLHYPTIKAMSLMTGTQLSTASHYLVLNSYVVKKVKWYQRGFFKVVLVIASAVISVVFAPAGAGILTTGILGSNLAIGVAMGFTTALGAAVAGAIVNSLAAMIITTMISKVSGDIFGKKIGAIIGTIATFVAMTYASNFAATGSFSVDWGSMMRADRLMDLTKVVGSAYQKWLEVDTLEIYEKMAGLQEQYEDQLQEIEDLSDEILGMTNSVIDPMMFTETEYFGENSESFLGRTLLTGSDIAALTHAMIENFAEISLELPKSYSGGPEYA